MAASRDTEMDADLVFAGNGEMAELGRQFDWASGPLGPVSNWSLALRTIVRTMIASRHPMFLFWGAQLVQVYNDAYRPSFAAGNRHPHALGARGKEFWTDIWDTIGPQIEGVMQRGESTWHEDQFLPILRNGQIEDVWWTYGYSPVYDDDGSIGGTFVVCTETTGRVMAERALEMERNRLADVFRQAPSFLAVLRGKDHVFERANSAYFDIVGHRDIIGKPVREALPEVADQGFTEILDQVLETGAPFVGREVELLVSRSPGEPQEPRYIDFVYQPLEEMDGVRSGVIAHGVDVTEQVNARRAAESASRAKDDFLATVNHELRSPLNAIANNAHLLGMEIGGPLTPEQRATVDRILRGHDHLLAMINQLLDLKAAAVGRLSLEISSVSIDRAVAAAIAIMELEFTRAGLSFTHGAPSHATVLGDSSRIQQIVINLLANACKFTPTGGLVTLLARMDDSFVHVDVTDTGIGIPPDLVESVFEPFVQVKDRRRNSVVGSGLGLAISRELARSMGGNLTLSSEPNVGSTFTLSLPRVPDQ